MTSTFEALTSSATDEWYTPPSIIESARELMGGIDIDPASNPLAQEWIKATVYYRKHQDGLLMPWGIGEGRLWLNPPYGKRSAKTGNYGAGAWFAKAHAEYKLGSISQGVCLGRGDSAGLKLLMLNCYFCECDRIAFISADGKTSTKPVPGSKLFYLGSNRDGFVDLFRQYGTILRAV